MRIPTSEPERSSPSRVHRHRTLASAVAVYGTYTVNVAVVDNAPSAANTAMCKSFDFTVLPDADLDMTEDSLDLCPYNADPAATPPGCGCPRTTTFVANCWYLEGLACSGSDTLDGNYDEIIDLPLPYASLDVDPGGASEDTWWANAKDPRSDRHRTS